MNIYGHEVELTEVEDGEMVTDVIVLARSVRSRNDDRPEEALLVSGTTSTTYGLQMGMLRIAQEVLGVDFEDEDEDEQ